MRREIVVQLVLTALALVLLLFVIFFHQPTYVEEFPEGVSAPVAAETEGEGGTGVAPGEAETAYTAPRRPRPETPYRPSGSVRLSRSETRYRR